MYSEEIKRLLEMRNYIIDSETYHSVFNPKNTPQINYAEYNAFEDNLRVHTSDNYDFKFKVYKKEKQMNSH